MEAMIYHRAFVMQDNLRNLECGSVCVALILTLTDFFMYVTPNDELLQKS